VDSSFVGLTVLLQGSQKRLGKGFRIVGAQDTVVRLVRYCCADYLLTADEPERARRNQLMRSQDAQLMGSSNM
jgi:hypothetical protein